MSDDKGMEKQKELEDRIGDAPIARDLKAEIVLGLLTAMGTDAEEKLINAQRVERHTSGAAQAINDMSKVFEALISELEKNKKQDTGSIIPAFRGKLQLFHTRAMSTIQTCLGRIDAYQERVTDANNRIDAYNKMKANSNVGVRPSKDKVADLENRRKTKPNVPTSKDPIEGDKGKKVMGKVNK